MKVLILILCTLWLLMCLAHQAMSMFRRGCCPIGASAVYSIIVLEMRPPLKWSVAQTGMFVTHLIYSDPFKILFTMRKHARY